MTQVTEDFDIDTDHNVYILGAGFSVDAGIPVLNDFLSQMRYSQSRLREENRQREVDAISKVFRFRKEAARAAERVDLNLENIEDLFSLAAACVEYPLADHIATAIAGTIDYSQRTATQQTFEVVIDDHLKHPFWAELNRLNDDARYMIPPYELYAGLLSGRICSPSTLMNNTIITFNYDTVLEDALGRWRIPFWYGFKSGSVEYEASSKCAHQDQPGALPVFKLHGSVNWAKSPNSELSIYGSYSDVLATDRSVTLIAPTWRKAFQGPLSEVWDAAIRALNKATRIVIIGFSVPPTDIHFRYLLAAGLQGNISLESISCFNPCAQVEENLFRILRPELRDRRIATFHQNSTRDLCIGRMANDQRLSTLFNRGFSKSVGDVTLGREINMDLNAQS